MQRAKTITVDIDATGDSTVDLAGFNGQGCDKVLKDFAGADEAQTLRHKPEYHQQATVEERARG